MRSQNYRLLLVEHGESIDGLNDVSVDQLKVFRLAWEVLNGLNVGGCLNNLYLHNVS